MQREDVMFAARVCTALTVTLAVITGSAVSANAGNRLSEKHIIKKLIFKKKTRRPATRQRGIERTKKRHSTPSRRIIRRAEPGQRQLNRRKVWRRNSIEVEARETRRERRSATRRNKLRKLLQRKRTRRTTTQGITFPPPAVEIVDGRAQERRRKVRKPKGKRDRTRWVKAKTKRTAPRRKSVWRRKTEQPARHIARPVQVATTRYERDQIANIVGQEDLPQIDVEIYFDYDSATVRPQSMPDLGVLGRALRNEQLAGAQFMIIGHTDATGGEYYNLRLSEERAHAVRNFLVDAFGLDGERFYPMGYGEEKLKRPYRPAHAQNRRVQIVNIGSAQY